MSVLCAGFEQFSQATDARQALSVLVLNCMAQRWKAEIINFPELVNVIVSFGDERHDDLSKASAKYLMEHKFVKPEDVDLMVDVLSSVQKTTKLGIRNVVFQGIMLLKNKFQVAGVVELFERVVHVAV